MVNARIAVCVAGAVRSLIDEKVMVSLGSFYSETDVYFHLYTNVELSQRGQRNISKVDARALSKAMINATAVRFQTEENEPRWPDDHGKIF